MTGLWAKYLSWSLLLLVLLPSCKLYQNKMFQTETSIAVDSIRNLEKSPNKNYVIHKNDYLSVLVYTSKGEMLVDPNNELSKQGTKENKTTTPVRYLVRDDGKVNLPMVGDVALEGLTLGQSDSVLGKKYSEFYSEPYVITRILNNRVIVLGAAPSGAGGGGKVIPLENEKMNLIEVLALYGGISDHGKSHNIRLIRGDLKNPDVQVIDLSTIEGMKKASLDVQPNDIIYIEPKRRLFTESLQQVLPIVSVLSTMMLLFVAIRNSFK